MSDEHDLRTIHRNTEGVIRAEDRKRQAIGWALMVLVFVLFLLTGACIRWFFFV